MTKRTLVVAAALLSSSLNTVAIAPLHAQNGGITDPQEYCDEQLRPNNPNSEFTSVPQSVSAGSWSNVGAPYQEPNASAISEEGWGTPTASNVFLSNSYWRNGDSPNV